MMTPKTDMNLFVFASFLLLIHRDLAQCSTESAGDQMATSSGGNCMGESISYDTTRNVAKKFDFDKLSDEDYTFYDSKPPEFWESEGQETTLRQVIFIHRHGDRTPISFAPEDKLADHPFWKFHGPGQITNRGKARLHMLGEIIRMRYNKFLGGSVSKNIRKSRASGSQRCIESAQVFLSSFLGLDKVRNSPDADDLVWDRSENILSTEWQPANIATLPAKIDGMLNEGAHCASLDEEYEKIDSSFKSKKLFEDYEAEAKLLKELLGFDIDHFYKWFWASSFIEVERSYIKGVDSRLLKAYDRISNAGDSALVLYQSTWKSKKLRAGLLINEMINNMNAIKDSVTNGGPAPGTFVKKFVHYSAHDLNLVVLLGMFQAIEKFPYRPDYASNIMIELHQDADEWFVKLFYMPRVPADIIELHLPGCEQKHPKSRCTLDEFETLMQTYRIDSWHSWMKECGNDLSLADPYEQNL